MLVQSYAVGGAVGLAAQMRYAVHTSKQLSAKDQVLHDADILNSTSSNLRNSSEQTRISARRKWYGWALLCDEHSGGSAYIRSHRRSLGPRRVHQFVIQLNVVHLKQTSVGLHNANLPPQITQNTNCMIAGT